MNGPTKLHYIDEKEYTTALQQIDELERRMEHVTNALLIQGKINRDLRNAILKLSQANENTVVALQHVVQHTCVASEEDQPA